MATYYKYAERSAESQINWAEIGKNMTDMLRDEVAIREEKKAAIDKASREFGEELANAPQGEHKGMNTWALEYGDNASQFLLMQDRLLKNGLLKPKDYVVTRQNLMDGTKQAFNLSKEFQETYAKKMERYKKGESQDLELWLNAQAEKFGDFTKSQLYINPTDGTVNVAMKEKQMVNGKEVYVMNKNPNEFATINSLRNSIAGTYDKFDTNAVTTAFVDSLGEDIKSSIFKASSTAGGGFILDVESIEQRTDIDPQTKAVLYKFADSENQFINASLENPFNRLSVLTNTKKFAPNGKQYTFTYDEADAKANPEKVLLRIDSASGQPTPEFTEEQMKVSNDVMRTELRAKYDRKEELRATPQAQAQFAPAYVNENNQKKKDAENFGRQLGTALKSGDDEEVGNAIKYLAQKSGRQVDRQGDKIVIRDINGQGESVFDLKAEPDKIAAAMVSAFGADLPEDIILKFAKETFKGNPTNTTTKATGINVAEPPKKVDVSLSSITQPSQKAIVTLQGELPPGFTVKEVGFNPFGNDIEITAPDGKTKYNFTSGKSATAAEIVQKDLINWVTKNAGKGTKEL